MEIRHRAFCQRLTAVDRHRLLLLLFVLPPSAYETSQSVSQSANNRAGTRSDASKTHALHSLLSHVTLTLPQSLAITRGVLPAEQHRRKTTFIHDPAKSHHAPVSCLLLPLPLHHFSGRNGAPLKNWIQIKVDVNFISRSPLYPSPSATTPSFTSSFAVRPTYGIYTIQRTVHNIWCVPLFQPTDQPWDLNSEICL